MRYRQVSYSIYLIILLALIAVVTITPKASAYQVVIFDGHVHSKYSDEGFVTKNTIINKIDEDLSKTFGSGIWTNVGCAITDHSDVARRYMFRSILTEQEWAERESDINNVSSPYVLIPGEEVTIGNGSNFATEGHFLAYGLNSMIPMPFASSATAPLEPDPDEPGDLLLPKSVYDGDPPRKGIREILSSMGGFGYIAHPNTGSPWTGYSWYGIKPYLGSKVKGLEILSAGKDQGVKTKPAWQKWESILQHGKNFYVVGGSDSHGQIYPQMGSSFTYVLLADGDDPADRGNVVRALRKGNTIASNGPFVNIMVDNGIKQHLPGDTVIVEKGGTVCVNVEWNHGTNASLLSYGPKIEVYECPARKTGGFRIVKTIGVADLSGAASFDYQVKENTYLMAKLVSTDLVKNDLSAYTSPVFIDPPGTERGIIDVALVIDCSGSMSSNDPSYKRREAAKQFIDLVQTGDKIAVIGYNTDAYVFASLQEVAGQADRDSLKQSVDQVFASGITDIGEGLLVGKDELATEILTEVRKGIILLTDGKHNADLYQDEHLQCYQDGIRVFTIGLGRSTDPQFLQRAAEETGGKYYTATDAGTLQSIYNELSQAVAGGSQVASDQMDFTMAGTVANRIIEVRPGTLQGLFSIIWPGSDYAFTLIRPDGRELNPQSPDPDYSYVKGPTYASYTVDNPDPGSWTCVITALEVPPGGETVELSLNAIESTPPELSLEGFQDGYLLDSPITITARAVDTDGFVNFKFFLDMEEMQSYPVSAGQNEVSADYLLDPDIIGDGPHTLMFWAKDSNFSVGTAELSFIIDKQPPVADAGPDQSVKVGEEVGFDASNSKDLHYTTWDYGDGTSGTGFGPGFECYSSHIYEQPGVYTVTLIVHDVAGNTATDQMIVTVTGAEESAQACKQKASESLKAISKNDLSWGQNITRQLAIHDLCVSLNEAFWVDEKHLDQLHGYLVFTSEELAVAKINGIISDNKKPVAEPVKQQLAAVRDDLVMADQILALTALEEAQAALVQNQIWRTLVDQHIAIAQSEIAAARQEAEAGHHQEAIQHYREAWANAQLALKFAQCNLLELPQDL